MIGPFIYFDNPDLGKTTLITHEIREESGERYGDYMTSPYGHSKLFDVFMKRYPEYDLEYMDYPRGRVMYNVELNEHMIRIDKCIMDQIPKVAFIYGITKYKVEEDDHYVCPNCIGDIWNS